MFNINPFRSNLIRSLRNEYLPCFLTNTTRGISFSSPLAFNTTPSLMSMPTKRKRKIDPQILKLRLDRKKKKVEKEIRMFEKVKKTLKPIEEARMPSVLLFGKEARQRIIHVPESEQEERILLQKDWVRYGKKQADKDLKNIKKIIMSQNNALKELRTESEILYEAAIQIDETLIPFKYEGPSDTPAIKNYNSPDGDYVDISKDWLQEWKQRK